MRKEVRLQAALAIGGCVFILTWWQPDAKWPNPFRLKSGARLDAQPTDEPH